MSLSSRNSVLSTQYSVLVLALILIAYFIVGGLFAIKTPAWQAPDEPAHYNYIVQVAYNGCCPKIEPGDWDSAYLDQLKAAKFAPDLLAKLPTVQYEDHQPPLYYLLETPVFTLTNGSLIALRLFSLVMGAGIILCAYGLVRAFLPEKPQVALGTAALVAFLPQHLAGLASVSNDALSNLLIAATLLGTVLYLKGETAIREWHLGLLVGLGLLTKVSTIFLLGFVPLAILVRWWVDSNQSSVGNRQSIIRQLVPPLAAFFIPALVLGGIWWIHSINTYGFPDLFGLRQHDKVVTGQPRTAELIAQVGFVGYLKVALQTTFNSFWGQFGWMGVPMPNWIYVILLGLLAVTGSGLIINLQPASDAPRMTPTEITTRRIIWTFIQLAILLAVLEYIYYNTVFLQLQGRYMFTGIIPFALVVVLGIDAWRVWLARRLIILHPLITVLPFALFALLDLYLLWRVIVPALSL
jgi:4-amino-4-deoxy-L-arabinose transferase-like glycosyltransferase